MLGTVEKDGVFKSIEVCGARKFNCKKRGTLKVFLLRNNTKKVEAIYYFKLIAKSDDCAHFTDYNSDENPKAGDLVAVYIQEDKLRGEPQCPFQVNMLQNTSKSNRYKFYKGSSFNETIMSEQELRQNINHLLNHIPNLCDINNVEFNIRMRIQSMCLWASSVPLT